MSMSMSILLTFVLAGISCICTYPLDLARARFAVSASGNVKHPRFVIFRNIYGWVQTDGVRGLYRGIVPTLMGVIPYGAIAFSMNERGKAAVCRLKEQIRAALFNSDCSRFAHLQTRSRRCIKNSRLEHWQDWWPNHVKRSCSYFLHIRPEHSCIGQVPIHLRLSAGECKQLDLLTKTASTAVMTSKKICH